MAGPCRTREVGRLGGFLLLVLALTASTTSAFVVQPRAPKHCLGRRFTTNGNTCLQPSYCKRAAVLADASDNNEPPAELTTAKVAELIEVSFVRACMDVSSGYVDTLKLFIVSAKGAYEIGCTIPAISLALSMVETQTAGRPLMAEEVDLRSLWIALVYLTLEAVDHPARLAANVGATVPEDTRAKFEPFVRGVVDRKRRGFTLQALKLEELLGGESQPEQERSAMETAILSQSMRLIFLTLTVLDEEFPPPGKREPNPKPFIPGGGR